MKIVITDAKTITNGDVDFAPIEALGDLVKYELTPYNQIAERIKDADAVILNKTVLCQENLKDAKNLKYIGLFATGYNNIDLNYTNAHGITVCNAGSYSTNAVAQHTFALILNFFNSTSKYEEFCAEGEWSKSETFSPFNHKMNELAGKTMGLVGYGNIAKKVAKIAKAFDMKVLAYSRSGKGDENATAVCLDELLANSDIVSVHCPLNKESDKMFNRETFAKFKDGAFFVNTARGGVLDEQALFDALENGKLAGAGIDVLETEPMAHDCILFKAKNITLTPHVAWAPVETRKRLIDIVADNLKNFQEGHPTNVVVK